MKTSEKDNTVSVKNKPKRRPPFINTLFRTTFSLRNIPLLIYMVLNYTLSVVILAAIFGWLHIDLKIPEEFAKGASGNPFLNVTQHGYILCALISLGLYIVGVFVILSPAAEALFRFKYYCKRIKNPDYFYKIVPIFNHVLEVARTKDGSISKHVKIYIDYSDEVNAFTLGRNTVCITEGLLLMDEKTIEAVLAHELGHLSHRDFDVSMVVRYGNLFVFFVIMLMVIFAKVMEIFARVLCSLIEIIAGAAGDTLIFGILVFACEAVFFIFRMICTVASFVLQYAVLQVWFAIGDIFCHKTSRLAEFDADKFAYRIGYGNELSKFLLACGDAPEIENEGIYARLIFTHPDTSDRIDKLNKLCLAD